MRRTIALLAALILPSAAAAQSFEDVVAYVSLVSTPVGGVAATPHASMIYGGARTPAFVSLRGGTIRPFGPDDNDRFSSMVVTIGLPGTQRAGLSLSLGGLIPGCEECDTHVVGSLAGYLNILPDASNGRPVNVGVASEVGIGWPEDGTIMAASVTVPVAFVARTGGIKVVSHIAPGIGFGQMRANGDSETGSRPLAGGGVTLISSKSGIGLNVGAQKVFIEDGGTTFGASLIFGFPDSRP